jgi:hypothetical protein
MWDLATHFSAGAPRAGFNSLLSSLSESIQLDI